MKWITELLAKIAGRMTNQWFLYLSFALVIALGGLLLVSTAQDAAPSTRYTLLVVFLGFLVVFTVLALVIGVLGRLLGVGTNISGGNESMNGISYEYDQTLLDILVLLSPSKYDAFLAILFRDPVDANALPSMTRPQVFGQLRNTGRIQQYVKLLKEDRALLESPDIKRLIDKLP